MPHHVAIVAMVVLGSEEANGKGRHRDADYCPHDEVEDGHIPSSENATVNRSAGFPQLN
jgi:hypothetical protein